MRNLTHRLKMLAVAITAILMSGCFFGEHIDEVILYAPQFHARFNTDQAPVAIQNGRIFVYNSQNILIKDTLLSGEQLASTDPLILVKGIASGDYKMVAYYNIANTLLAGNTVDQSKLDELELKLNTSTALTEATDIDSICHCSVNFTIQRGLPTIMNTPINTAHYCIDVRVTGLDRLTQAPGEIGVHLLDIPLSIDAMTTMRQKHSIIVPLEKTSTDRREGHCMTLSFKTSDGAKLQILEDNTAIQTLSLEPERYISNGAERPNYLLIEVQFYANSYIVLVNDWKIGEFELTEVGG